jgi:hypothetical protein
MDEDETAGVEDEKPVIEALGDEEEMANAPALGAAEEAAMPQD